MIQESINQKSYIPLIAHLEQQEQKEIEFFIPSTPLKKAVTESCNIYLINARLEDKYIYGSEEGKEAYTIDRGHYVFEVAAKSKKEALATARDVLDVHCDEGHVANDCTTEARFSVGDEDALKKGKLKAIDGRSSFKIVGNYSFKNKKAKEKTEKTED